MLPTWYNLVLNSYVCGINYFLKYTKCCYFFFSNLSCFANHHINTLCIHNKTAWIALRSDKWSCLNFHISKLNKLHTLWFSKDRISLLQSYSARQQYKADTFTIKNNHANRSKRDVRDEGLIECNCLLIYYYEDCSRQKHS